MFLCSKTQEPRHLLLQELLGGLRVEESGGLENSFSADAQARSRPVGHLVGMHVMWS